MTAAAAPGMGMGMGMGMGIAPPRFGMFPFEFVWSRLAREDDEAKRWDEWMVTARTACVPPGAFTPWRLEKVREHEEAAESGARMLTEEGAGGPEGKGKREEREQEEEGEGEEEGDVEEEEGGGLCGGKGFVVEEFEDFDEEQEAEEQTVAVHTQAAQEMKRTNSKPVKLYNKVTLCSYTIHCAHCTALKVVTVHMLLLLYSLCTVLYSLHTVLSCPHYRWSLCTCYYYYTHYALSCTHYTLSCPVLTIGGHCAQVQPLVPLPLLVRAPVRTRHAVVPLNPHPRRWHLPRIVQTRRTKAL
jgi:hypothetical protein